MFKKVVYTILGSVSDWLVTKFLDFLIETNCDLSQLTLHTFLDTKVNIISVIVFLILLVAVIYFIWFYSSDEKRSLKKLNKQAVAFDETFGEYSWTVAPPNLYNPDYHCSNVKIKCPEHHVYLTQYGNCPISGCRVQIDMNELKAHINTFIIDQINHSK